MCTGSLLSLRRGAIGPLVESLRETEGRGEAPRFPRQRLEISEFLTTNG
jgi:hypothetical protein